MEFIIENVSDEEVDILDRNDIDWYPDDILLSRDIVVHCTSKEMENILKLIRRK